MKKYASVENMGENVPLAVFSFGSQTGMLVKIEKKSGIKKSHSLGLAWSLDGLRFVADSQEVVLHTVSGRKEDIEQCRAFSVSSIYSGYVLTYIRTKFDKRQK